MHTIELLTWRLRHAYLNPSRRGRAGVRCAVAPKAARYQQERRPQQQLHVGQRGPTHQYTRQAPAHSDMSTTKAAPHAHHLARSELRAGTLLRPRRERGESARRREY